MGAGPAPAPDLGARTPASRSRQERIDGLGGTVVLLIEDVGVDPLGHRRRGVTEDRLHGGPMTIRAAPAGAACPLYCATCVWRNRSLGSVLPAMLGKLAAMGLVIRLDHHRKVTDSDTGQRWPETRQARFDGTHFWLRCRKCRQHLHITPEAARIAWAAAYDYGWPHTLLLPGGEATGPEGEQIMMKVLARGLGG